MPFVYILYSEKLDRFYIGFTQNFDARMNFHLNDTQTRKFTYNADDWNTFLKIECESKTQGLKIEAHIKAMRARPTSKI